MCEASDRVPDSMSPPLDRERRLIQEAILMVASGRSPRVVLAGIRFGAALLDPGRRAADEAGVRLIARPRADDLGADVDIEVRSKAVACPEVVR